MNENLTIVTEKLLKFCYTCDHAYECESEADSVECWNGQEQADLLNDEDETRRLLRMYAE